MGNVVFSNIISVSLYVFSSSLLFTNFNQELRKQHSIQQSTPSPALVITPTPALPRSRAASHVSNNTKSLTPAQNGNSRSSSSIIDDPSPILANQSIVSPALTNQKVAHDPSTPIGLNSNQNSVSMLVFHNTYFFMNF